MVGDWTSLGPFRTSTIPKVYFATFSMGTVFILPFVNLWFRHCGFGEEMIGLLCAVKPWVAASSGSLIVSAADASQRYMVILLAVYIVAWLGRSLMAFFTGFTAQLVIALLTEAAASPQGTLVDAAVSASATDDGGYGRIRMWASVGWGCTAPLAGFVVREFGLEAAFLCFSVLVGLTLLPTALMPMEVLSSRTKGAPVAGSGAVDAGTGSGRLSLTDKPADKLGSEDGGALTSLRISSGRSQGLEAPGAWQASGHPAAKAGPGSPVKSWIIGTGAGGGGTPVVHLVADCRGPKAKECISDLPSPQRPLLSATDASASPSPPTRPAPATRTCTTSPLEIAAAAGRTGSKAQLQLVPSAALTAGSSAGGDVSVWAGVKGLLADVDVAVFLFLAFLMGVGNGCIGYLFLFLDELGGTGTLMGLCLTFNCAAEVPVFYLSGPILERLGVKKALNLAMAAYVVRLCCYLALPLLPSTWCVLPIELLQGLTFALAWSAGCVHVKHIAPLHLKSTVQSIFAGLYMGVGSGLGGLVGGLLYGKFGSAALFRTAALALAIGWAAATAVQRTWGASGGKDSGESSSHRGGSSGQTEYGRLEMRASTEEGGGSSLLRP